MSPRFTVGSVAQTCSRRSLGRVHVNLITTRACSPDSLHRKAALSRLLRPIRPLLRLGMLGMFALVIFTVSAIGSIAAEQNVAVNKLVAQDSGGYDIITTTVTPVSNLTSRVMNDPGLQGRVASVTPFNTTFLPVYDITTGQDLPPRSSERTRRCHMIRTSS